MNTRAHTPIQTYTPDGLRRSKAERAKGFAVAAS